MSGAVSEVLHEAWPQREAILRRSPRRAGLALYLDSETYRRCLCDQEVMTYLRPRPDSSEALKLQGMEVFEVVTNSKHVRVAEVVGDQA